MFFWLNKILQGLKMASQTLQTIRNGWAPEIKRLNDNLEKLEASLTGRVKVLEARLDGVEDNVELRVSQNEGDRKIELFEEQIKALELLVTTLYKYIREQRS